MGLFDGLGDLIKEREESMEKEREIARDELMKLSEKELLVEIILRLDEIKYNQFFYDD